MLNRVAGRLLGPWRPSLLGSSDSAAGSSSIKCRCINMGLQMLEPKWLRTGRCVDPSFPRGRRITGEVPLAAANTHRRQRGRGGTTRPTPSEAAPGARGPRRPHTATNAPHTQPTAPGEGKRTTPQAAATGNNGGEHSGLEGRGAMGAPPGAPDLSVGMFANPSCRRGWKCGDSLGSTSWPRLSSLPDAGPRDQPWNPFSRRDGRLGLPS